MNSKLIDGEVYVSVRDLRVRIAELATYGTPNNEELRTLYDEVVSAEIDAMAESGVAVAGTDIGVSHD